tara:strand:+ start:99 stop:464 length:366 start_codon:yes stop_codon:yes gene_type:complete
MANYAIIENQTIINVIEWDGDTNTWSPPDGSISVLLDTPSIGIGDSYIGGEFIKVDSYTTAEHWENLRSQRNLRLEASDWSQLPDVPVGIRTSYQTYRQELRDLPANTVDPRNVTWPEHPE